MTINPVLGGSGVNLFAILLLRLPWSIGLVWLPHSIDLLWLAHSLGLVIFIG